MTTNGRYYSQAELMEEGSRLYESFGRPLESSHRGQYVAVSRDGKTIIASSLEEAIRQAKTTFGPGHFVFKIGDRAIGSWL
jgi:hypothetical protein